MCYIVVLYIKIRLTFICPTSGKLFSSRSLSLSSGFSSVVAAGVSGNCSGSDSGCILSPDPPSLPHAGVEDAALCNLLLCGWLWHHPRLPLGLAKRRFPHRDRASKHGIYTHIVFMKKGGTKPNLINSFQLFVSIL